MANPNPKPPPLHSRFKKGEVRNPLGSKAHNPKLKKLTKLTIETYGEVIETALTGTIQDLVDIAKDPKTTALQAGIASSLIKAFKNGDATVLKGFAEAIVGKIPDKIEITSKNHTVAQVAIIDPTKLKEALAELDDEF